MSTEKKLTVLYEGKSYTVSWYSGSTDAAIEKTIRAALGLEENAPLRLVDEKSDIITICDALPDGLSLTYAPVTDSLIVPKGPRPLPFVGNLFDLISREGVMPARLKLVSKYGSMIPLQLPGLNFFVCSDADVLQDVLKNKNFQKSIPPLKKGLGNLRAYTTGDGLFTSSDNEEIWQIAHRILLPGFGVEAIRQYYGRMLEVADELINHLAYTYADEPILITDWMTRMTFEAIGYAGFSKRFHCMDSKNLPPFVKAMVISLSDALKAAQRLLPESFYFLAKKKRQRADALMRETVDAVIQERKKMMERGEPVPNDLLQLMLTNKDRLTGKKLPEENIRYQLITFLIAGHETTSGLLSYAIYRLMTNPDVEQKLMEEVDRVLGRDFSVRPAFEDLEKLQYTERVLKESLRLDPTAPGFARMALQDTIVAGKYAVKKGNVVFFFLPSLHRNSHYWSGDPERFDPDRFLPEEISKRHPDAYHPFGAGIRSCIGFQFALTEAKMVLARLYQRFRFRLQDKNYRLKHVETLTVKPKNLYVWIEKRQEEKGKAPKKEVLPKESIVVPEFNENAPPILILYGSNMGTCQGIARNLAQQALLKGYRPVLGELDGQADQPWQSSYAVIVTSTYNGTPPDNALAFDKWLRDLKGTPFSAMHYTVLGVGNKLWHATFQHFPQFVNKRMLELGAQSFYPPGEADVDGDYDHAIEAWSAGIWQQLQQILPPAETQSGRDKFPALTYSCEVVNYAGAHLQSTPNTLLDQRAQQMAVRHNEELQSADSGRSTRHIEVLLASGVAYTAGDHLGVLPENPPEAVALAAKIFNLRLTDVVVLKNHQDLPKTELLPIGIPISVQDLLTAYVDLLGPLSRNELRILARHCPCPPDKKALEELSDAKFVEEILAKERTLLDVCQEFCSISFSLELLLSVRPVLKPRYYSISSSPLMMSESCSITVGVQEHETAAGRLLKGVCSHYLARQSPNSQLQCFVKDTKSRFRLPDDPSKDLILIGPGTGLAPLRGFLQERNQQREQGVRIGRNLLFFGCRNPNQDYLYRKELEEYYRTGLLQGLFVAFSRLEGTKCYVQDLLLTNAPLVWEFVQNNACILVCGDAKSMAPDVRSAILRLFEKEGKISSEEAKNLFKEKQAAGLYVEDVWAP